MATSAQATNERRSGLSEANAVDPTLYKLGWLVGMAVGALTAFYRYAG
jgi:hypothetical protein